jgi:NhaP-type Na+/H+ or K+/H+ antiporter
MTIYLTIGITAIMAIGVCAQWLAWRFRLPSILLLLLFGFLAGPVTGFLYPTEVLGDLLFPVVKISVAIILFEGGLGLKLRELSQVGAVVRNLVTLGMLITWVLGSLAAHFILNLDLDLSILLGAILVVTGPTVIGPLLSHIRPTTRVASTLKWEGIIIDPIGAVLAVLVFEAILVGGLQQALPTMAMGILYTLLIGSAVGALSALLIILMLRNYWLPDFLQSPATLMTVLVSYAISDYFQAESGLLTVTVMGIVLANQKSVSLRRIVEFKENLRVLLIAGLFVILAAGLKLTDFTHMGVGVLWFLLALFVVRILMVQVSTIGSHLKLRERLFISWMAPRGIVAAAVASVFAFELVRRGYPQAYELVPITFTVIIGTVSIYSLTAPIVARVLGVATPNPQGVLVVGGHFWARKVAQTIKDLGFRVLLVDSNISNVSAARMENLASREVDVLSQAETDELDLEGIGQMLALTSNDELNSLASLHFSNVFGEAHVYQLPVKIKKETPLNDQMKRVKHLRGRFLFDPAAIYSSLNSLFFVGAEIRRTLITKDFNAATFQAQKEKQMIPLFIVTPEKELIVYSTDISPTPRLGQTLVSIVPVHQDSK